MRVRSSLLGSLGPLMVFMVGTLAVDQVGRKSRFYDQVYPLTEPDLPVLLVEDAAQMLDAWQARGLHGRVILYASAHLHFIGPEEMFAELDLAEFPYDLVATYEGYADDAGFLWAAARTGIAREIIHLLPSDVFTQKLETLDLAEVDRVEVRELGLRRTVVAEPPALGEAVLLGIDASLFDSERAAEVLEHLLASGLKTDLMILNLAEDSSEVSQEARRRLREWYGSFRSGGEGA